MKRTKFEKGDLVLWGEDDKFLPSGLYFQLGIVHSIILVYDNGKIEEMLMLSTVNEYLSPPAPVLDYSIVDPLCVILISKAEFNPPQ